MQVIRPKAKIKPVKVVDVPLRNAPLLSYNGGKISSADCVDTIMRTITKYSNRNNFRRVAKYESNIDMLVRKCTSIMFLTHLKSLESVTIREFQNRECPDHIFIVWSDNTHIFHLEELSPGTSDQIESIWNFTDLSGKCNSPRVTYKQDGETVKEFVELENVEMGEDDFSSDHLFELYANGDNQPTFKIRYRMMSDGFGYFDPKVKPALVTSEEEIVPHVFGIEIRTEDEYRDLDSNNIHTISGNQVNSDTQYLMLYITSVDYWQRERCLSDILEECPILPYGVIPHCENSYVINPNVYPATEIGISELKSELTRRGYTFDQEFSDFVQE